ncbi:EamA family transporter [Marinitoga litoralis]|jgi:drug/metabolite transporter (DMT)-like permease|uniref:EamA family transporter n=1 Tax=Marinitoga litoralis TaxID=570855 RepID=UPI0019603610|nr:EamA family transporter [Marinitoga litoralis]MBM7559983.1 drug/metabolite transporter (DMT)-like permease [Marinitoga litoralis]
MLNLILAIICSSLIAIIFKFSNRFNPNIFLVTSSNYFIATLISFILIDKSLFKTNIVFPILLGIPTGLLFFLSFLFYQKSIKNNGATLSGAFAKLGILYPVFLSMLIWREIPKPINLSGIFIAILGIIIVYFPIKGIKVNFDLILLSLFGGIAEFTNKIFQKYGIIEQKDIFLFFVFLSAMFFSIFMVKSFTKKDIIIGLLVGIPNLFSSYFLILALNKLSAPIVFISYSTGSILLITLISYFYFKEKINNNQKIGIIVILLSLILMNL